MLTAHTNVITWASLLSALSSNVTRCWIIRSKQVSGPRTCVKLSSVRRTVESCKTQQWGDVGIVINVNGNIWPSMTMGRWGQGKLSATVLLSMLSDTCWHVLSQCQGELMSMKWTVECTDRKLNGQFYWIFFPARRNDPDNQRRTSRGVTRLWRHDGALRSSYSRNLVTFNLNWLLTTAPICAMTSPSIISTLGPLIGRAGLWHGNSLVSGSLVLWLALSWA